MHRDAAQNPACLKPSGRPIPVAWLLLATWLLAGGWAVAQVPNNRSLRIVPSDQFQGRMGLLLESKIRGRTYLYSQKGFYRREMVVSRLTAAQAGPTLLDRLQKFFLSDYQKYYILYAGYQRRDLAPDRLLLRGPFAQAAIRRYFLHRGPEGCYLNVGVDYALHFVGGYDQELRRTDPRFLIHAPGATLTTGWQFLLGHKNHWAIDLFAGGAWQQPIASRGPTHPARQALEPLRLVWGVGLGYAFHQRGRYF